MNAAENDGAAVFKYFEADTGTEGKLTNIVAAKVKSIGLSVELVKYDASLTESDILDPRPHAFATFINRFPKRKHTEAIGLAALGRAIELDIPSAVFYDNLKPGDREPFDFNEIAAGIEVIRLTKFTVPEMDRAVEDLATWLGSIANGL